jgi:L-lactate dehydrogenase complex protein LldF
MAEMLYNTEEIIDKSPARLAHHIRRRLRYALTGTEASVAAAQFLIADAGAAVLSDDEGATMFTSGIGRVSFIVAGIDCIVASSRDLDLLLSVYSTFSTGQPLKTYNTIVKGPRQASDVSGAEELYIVLIDNGRSEVLSHQHQRQVLSCINCGACLSASAIYKTVGGKAYPGPAQSIAAPVKHPGPEYKYLAELATLDGSGSEICPVKINFPSLVLHNRHDMVERGMNSGSEKWFYFAWKKAMLKRDMMSWAGAAARNKILENYFKSREGLRAMPVSAAKSFNQMWRERLGFK